MAAPNRPAPPPPSRPGNLMFHLQSDLTFVQFFCL